MQPQPAPKLDTLQLVEQAYLHAPVTFQGVFAQQTELSALKTKLVTRMAVHPLGLQIWAGALTAIIPSAAIKIMVLK